MPNIEIKAKYHDLDQAKSIAKKLMTDQLGELHQIDTYYKTENGRLKLREINGKVAQLIPYYKEYTQGPMKSCYSLLPVDNPVELKAILEKILGMLTIVDKKREVYLIGNIRVHLDRVKGLGNFIEFEAVYEENSPDAKSIEMEKVEELMRTFSISEDSLLDKSYIDYLLK